LTEGLARGLGVVAGGEAGEVVAERRRGARLVAELLLAVRPVVERIVERSPSADGAVLAGRRAAVAATSEQVATQDAHLVGTLALRMLGEEARALGESGLGPPERAIDLDDGQVHLLAQRPRGVLVAVARQGVERPLRVVQVALSEERELVELEVVRAALHRESPFEQRGGLRVLSLPWCP